LTCPARSLPKSTAMTKANVLHPGLAALALR